MQDRKVHHKIITVLGLFSLLKKFRVIQEKFDKMVINKLIIILTNIV